jgi:gluconate 2-dehydrogenase gamma chain
VPSQGYQLPLTPAELYRAGIAAANAFCVKTWGKSFDKIGAGQREEFLLGLQAGKVAFENGPPARVFFTTMYQNVVEGLFADPIYGGNRNKAGWKLIGFPGVIAVHYQNVEKYRDKKYSVDPVGISDMS